MNHAMLDLETMGVGPNAAIVAIGAVVFDQFTGKMGATFYQTVTLESSVREGGVMDASTVMWWLRQEGAARYAIQGGIPIDEALEAFSQWVSDHASGGPIVWGNGADFDNVILRSAYNRLSIDVPWGAFANRCYRTVKALYPMITIEHTGTRHNALDDARSQAEHLCRIMKDIATPTSVTTTASPSTSRTPI